MARHREKKHVLDNLILGTGCTMMAVGILAFLFFEFGGLIK